jgi:lysozyme
MAAPQRLSKKGRDFLIAQEGVRRYAYNDSAGHATFGVGHLIHRGPVTAHDRHYWGTPRNPKPMSFVYEILATDLLKYEKTVRDSIGRRMWQHRFDACVSLCFNIGRDPQHGFPSSTVAREIRQARKGFGQRAADAFLLWRNPPELLPRRKRERALFLHKRYG